MKKNLIKSFCIVLLLANFISACGSDTGTGGSSGSSSSGGSSSGPTSVGNATGNGNILYRFGGTFFLMEAVDGATPTNMDTLFDSAAGAGTDEKMNISRNGDYVVVDTTRLGCSGYACLARFDIDGTDGEKITEGAGGEDLHNYGSTQPAISPDGSRVVFPQQNADNSIDLYVMTRSNGVWSSMTNITSSSAYTYNQFATISADGSRVAFVCSNSLDEDPGNSICEVDIDGTDYQALIVPGTGNSFTNVLRPSYANNGDLYFEVVYAAGGATDGGERIWVLDADRNSAAVPAGNFLNAVSPCAMPNGNLAFLWLGRPGTSGVHELTLADTSLALEATLFEDDVDDVGMGCSE